MGLKQSFWGLTFQLLISIILPIQDGSVKLTKILNFEVKDTILVC